MLNNRSDTRRPHLRPEAIHSLQDLPSSTQALQFQQLRQPLHLGHGRVCNSSKLPVCLFLSDGRSAPPKWVYSYSHKAWAPFAYLSLGATSMAVAECTSQSVAPQFRRRPGAYFPLRACVARRTSSRHPRCLTMLDQNLRATTLTHRPRKRRAELALTNQLPEPP